MARDHKPSRRRARAAALTSVAALTLGGTALAELPAEAASRPRGHDVSSHQKSVNWSSAKKKGAKFAYVKATESTNYRNPYFGQQYNGARNKGIVRGAYHFAVPDKSSGRAQASYFVRNGGGWTRDGWTLPPALDIEYNPYSKKHKCYGMSKGKLVSWIRSFSDEVQRRTGRRPVIYTNYTWWKKCTGNSGAFASNHALWLAHYAKTAGPLPRGWSYWTFWQYANKGSLPGDQNLFNGSTAQLKRFARG
ncbi:hydrolase [Streptomyces sp. SID5785]|uniref:lysozyme n=1 Tax=Streptomyces sp. SID5785 TaxID=2690309 RepID=UPI0013619E96|nr:lysozyme [Streptomyces sp. SID5785]MZD03953.1 hydrolase [Streptomyces sp. SID5785]